MRAYNIQTLFSLSFYLPYMYRLEFEIDIDSVRIYIYMLEKINNNNKKEIYY